MCRVPSLNPAKGKECVMGGGLSCRGSLLTSVEMSSLIKEGGFDGGAILSKGELEELVWTTVQQGILELNEADTGTVTASLVPHTSSNKSFRLMLFMCLRGGSNNGHDCSWWKPPGLRGRLL